MNRASKTEELKDHPMLGRLYNRLTPSERTLLVDFINENTSCNKSEFEILINRMFLDKEKPKHHKEILELLSCLNTMSSQ